MLFTVAINTSNTIRTQTGAGQPVSWCSVSFYVVNTAVGIHVFTNGV